MGVWSCWDVAAELKTKAIVPTATHWLRQRVSSYASLCPSLRARCARPRSEERQRRVARTAARVRKPPLVKARGVPRRAGRRKSGGGYGGGVEAIRERVPNQAVPRAPSPSASEALHKSSALGDSGAFGTWS